VTAASSAEMSPAVLGRLADGTPFFAPVGKMVLDPAGERVRCHLCGGWYRALAPTHLRNHGWGHREYKAAFGLAARRPLQAPGLVAVHRTVMVELLRTTPSVREALRAAQQRLIAGEVARPVGRGPQSLEHRRKSAEAARAASQAQKARAMRARAARVRVLGYATVGDYLRRRYLVDHAPLEAIKRELGTGQATLAGLMAQAGIDPRARVAATADTRRRAKVDFLKGTPGPDGRPWGAYLEERALAGASVSAIARESGRSRDWVRSVLALLTVPAGAAGPAAPGARPA
jgi:hypothetical protein